MSLVTVEDVRAELQAAATAGIADEVLADRIARAETRIRTYCRWHIWPAKTETMTVNGTGADSLLLPTLRLRDVTNVTVDGTELPAGAYEWAVNGVLRRRGGRFPDRLQAVTVELAHGYDPDELDDLRDVLLGMIERVLTLPTGIKQSTTGDKSVTYGIDSSLRPTFGDREILDELRILR